MIFLFTSGPLKANTLKSYCLSSEGKKYPTIHIGKTRKVVNALGKKLNAHRIETAPTTQCLKTGELIANKFNSTISINPNLAPILFPMSKWVKKYGQGIENIGFYRELFLEELLADRLLESRASIQQRIHALAKRTDTDTLLCISHAFVIKLVECYRTDPNIFENLMILKSLFTPSQKPYGNLQGIQY